MNNPVREEARDISVLTEVDVLVHCCRSSVHEFGNLSSSARYADLACALYLTTLSYNILIRHSNACSAFAF